MPGEAERSIAGVRLQDGRLVWATGLPADLRPGAAVHLRWQDQEHAGILAVPGELILWHEPSLSLAAYLSSVPPPLSPPAPPIAAGGRVWLAPDAAPDDRTMAAMIALAHEERGRLDPGDTP